VYTKGVPLLLNSFVQIAANNTGKLLNKETSLIFRQVSTVLSLWAKPQEKADSGRYRKKQCE
jgi:hypothetical protein